MKKYLYLFIIPLLQSCWTCPESQSLEFTKSTKYVRVLSKDYYIKAIRITEYIPKEKSIELVDSNYADLIQSGERGAVEMSLNDIKNNYIVKGKLDFKNMLDKKYLEYIFLLERFDNRKDGNLDSDVISFVSEELKKEISIFHSKHPCP